MLCGTKINKEELCDMARFCGKCGTEISEEAVFDPNCGHSHEAGRYNGQAQYIFLEEVDS
jgi:hypothetical protein